ncbi:MAG TPA: glycosyltransferase family 1 protein [bacterium]|nr:glycosyltransferase family 1 protein [bacterium]
MARTYTRLAETLNDRKIDFLFVSPFAPKEKEPWRGRFIRVASVPFPLYRYYRIGIPPVFELEKAMDRFEPDLIQVAAPTPISLYGQNYAHRKKIPSVVSYHTHFVDYFPYYGYRWAMGMGWNYMRWFHNRSELTFAPTPGTARELQERGFHGVKLWPRGINGRKFSPKFRSEALRRKLKVGRQPLLLFVGRLVAEKDLGDLVEAALDLRRRGYQFQLAFAGDGPYRATLESHFPKDHFFGFIQGRPLAELYASSDLFVFPSTTETFGNVILEAYASGLPVIGVKQGGSADLVHHGKDGFLAKPRDPKDLALWMRKCLDAPALRKKLGKGALKTAAEYEWPIINGRLIGEYEGLIQEWRRTAMSKV